MSLADARSAGQAAMQLSLLAELDRNPDFSKVAREAILRHLLASESASGEELVVIAKAHGANCRDDRSFGGVFNGLVRANLIRCIRSDLPRKRGHGTSGGRLYVAVR